MVAVRFVAVYVCPVALPILVKLVLSVEDCHWIVPVFPANVSNVLFDPEQTVVDAGVTLPATTPGVTFTTTPEVVTGVQAPLLNCTRKYVVTERFVAV